MSVGAGDGEGTVDVGDGEGAVGAGDGESGGCGPNHRCQFPQATAPPAANVPYPNQSNTPRRVLDGDGGDFAGDGAVAGALGAEGLGGGGGATAAARAARAALAEP